MNSKWGSMIESEGELEMLFDARDEPSWKVVNTIRTSLSIIRAWAREGKHEELIENSSTTTTTASEKPEQRNRSWISIFIHIIYIFLGFLLRPRRLLKRYPVFYYIIPKFIWWKNETLSNHLSTRISFPLSPSSIRWLQRTAGRQEHVDGKQEVFRPLSPLLMLWR